MLVCSVGGVVGGSTSSRTSDLAACIPSLNGYRDVLSNDSARSWRGSDCSFAAAEALVDATANFGCLVGSWQYYEDATNVSTIPSLNGYRDVLSNDSSRTWRGSDCNFAAAEALVDITANFGCLVGSWQYYEDATNVSTIPSLNGYRDVLSNDSSRTWRGSDCSFAAAEALVDITANFGCLVGSWQYYEDATHVSTNHSSHHDHEVDTVETDNFEWWGLGYGAWFLMHFPLFFHYAVCFNFCSFTVVIWSGKFLSKHGRKRKRKRKRMFHITNQAVDAKQISSKPKRGAVMCRKVGHMRCKAPRAERCREQAKRKRNRWVAVWAKARGIAL